MWDPLHREHIPFPYPGLLLPKSHTYLSDQMNHISILRLAPYFFFSLLCSPVERRCEVEPPVPFLKSLSEDAPVDDGNDFPAASVLHIHHKLSRL